MITFKVVKNEDVYVPKESIEEFNQYLLTVDDIINTIELSNSHISEQKRTNALRAFFNNPNRVILRMQAPVFLKLSYGYGIVNGKLEKIIMWKDDKDRVNFGMFHEDETTYPEGTFKKIHVTDGDVFIKNQMSAAFYLAKVRNKQEEESKKNAKFIRKIEVNKAILKNLYEVDDTITKDMKVLVTKYFKLVAKKAKIKFKIHNCESTIESFKRKVKKE